tara:strand:- start:7798 stop:8232 length:435 start_codon:yes stop_codon:yes gene_type:complete
MIKALLPLAQSVAMNNLANKKTHVIRKSKIGLSLMTLAGFCLSGSVIFTIISGYGWLLTQYSQPIAALLVAGIIGGGALIFGLIGYRVLSKKPPPAVQSDEMNEIITLAIDILGKELTDPIRDNPKTSMLLASLAGYIAGDQFK